MQRRLRNALGQQPIRFNRGNHIVRLCGHHHIVKIAALKVRRIIGSALRQFLGKRQIIARHELLIKRSRVHAHANGNARFARRFNHFVGFFEAADVSRIDAQLRRATLSCTDGNTCIKVDIRDYGKGAFRAHFLERIQAIKPRNRHAHYFAASRRKPLDLRQIRGCIFGGSIQHGLHYHGSAAAQRHCTSRRAKRCVAHQHLARFLIRFHSAPFRSRVFPCQQVHRLQTASGPSSYHANRRPLPFVDKRWGNLSTNHRSSR